jgi:predicted MPP superfamily phosphohydrolase
VPSSWPRLGILHLSDLHVQAHGDRLFGVQQALLRGLERQPDLVVVTGDLCETPDDVERTLALLGTLRPRLGTYVVLGNHEHDAHGPQGTHASYKPAWVRPLNRVLGAILPEPARPPGLAARIAQRLGNGGVEVLSNRGVRLQVGGRSLWLAGADSGWAGRADLAAALRGRRADEACLVLVHEPELAFDAERHGGQLILAGHTHGGQVRFPLVGAPYTHRVDPRIRIASGFQSIGRSLLHISAGLGHTIPLRFGCPPEAVWLECLPAASALRQPPLAA